MSRDLKASRVNRAQRARKERLGHKATLGLLVRKARLGLWAPLDRMEPPARKALLARKGPPESRAISGQKVLRVHLGRLARRDRLDCKALRVPKGRPDRWGLRGRLE